jgi:hypothetical protein
MAKKNQKSAPLTLQEIILRGEADTIRQALEARIQIDALLEEREAAYRRISELEQQVEDIVGEENIFPFPEPPIPVANFEVKATPRKKPETKPKKSPEPGPASQAATPATPKKAEPSDLQDVVPGDKTTTDTNHEAR